MADLIYNRLATFSRATKVNDILNGARMENTVLYSNVPCSIQPSRSRHINSLAMPAGLSSATTNDMSAWTLLTRQIIDVKNGDTVIDDLGRTNIVVTAYPTGHGILVTLNPLTP